MALPESEEPLTHNRDQPRNSQLDRNRFIVTGESLSPPPLVKVPHGSRRCSPVQSPAHPIAHCHAAAPAGALLASGGLRSFTSTSSVRCADSQWKISC